MNRALKNFALGVASVATAGSALVALAPAASAVGARYSGTPVGSLEIRPQTGTNQSAIDYTTSGPCPGGTNFEARLFGSGLPDSGEVVTSRTSAGFSTSGPINGSFSNTPQFFADKNGVTLQGEYDVVVRCVERLGDTSRGDFLQRLTFTSPTSYTARTTSASPAPSASASARPSAPASTPASAPASTPPSSPAAASPSPAVTGAPSECTTPASVSLDTDVITATGSAGLTVRATAGRTVRLFAYSQPRTSYTAVREGTVGSDGTIRFEVKPPTNTRMYAQQVGCDPSPSVVLNVRTLLTLFATRNGTRDYTFFGRALPARPGGLIVTLYRVAPGGSPVITAQVRADSATGSYSFRRVFQGTGRFGFLVRTGQDLQNAPGASNTRPTLVY